MFFGGFPGGGFPGMDGGDGFPGMGGKGRGKKDVDTEAFYKLLDVDKNASGPDIKKAYRKLAIKHHPDKGGDPETFKEITKAYEVLSDENKRKLYDQYGEEGVESGGGGSDPTDIFDMVFGGGGGRRRGGGAGGAKRKGKDVVHPMDVTLEQLYNGHTKKLAINRTVIDQKVGVKECDACDGRGVVIQVMRMGNMIQQMQQQCTKCGGSGKIYKTKKEKEILEVFVDRGAPDLNKVVFYAKADEQPGYEAGDVQFVLQEKEHTVFKRNKADLTVQKNITLLEALTGFTMEITHLDGRKLLVKSAPGEVICPPKNVEADWEVFDEMESAGQDVATCTYSDPAKLKEVCLQKGFNGFVLDKESNKAIFRELTRDEFLSKKKKKAGMKLFVVPDPELLAAGRMRKCVKGEGMPVFKNPMLKGNLFIELTIDFPKSISEDAAKQLRKMLPGPDPMQVPDEEDEHFEHHYVVDMDPVTSEKEHAAAYEDDEDDERRAGMGGGQGVQCAQQ
ncbi:unnamed protein product [Amoebophrya sp. A120]|nr:unnamed protein product [Amoebophrya sp. A120]|eukprot:GSA120T00010630001.1